MNKNYVKITITFCIVILTLFLLLPIIFREMSSKNNDLAACLIAVLITPFLISACVIIEKYIKLTLIFVISGLFVINTLLLYNLINSSFKNILTIFFLILLNGAIISCAFYYRVVIRSKYVAKVEKEILESKFEGHSKLFNYLFIQNHQS